MCAAYEGWAEGVDLLVELGAKVNASNNAGDTAYAVSYTHLTLPTIWQV